MLPIAVAGQIFISDVAKRHKSEKITMPFEELCEVMTYIIQDHSIAASPTRSRTKKMAPWLGAIRSLTGSNLLDILYVAWHN